MIIYVLIIIAALFFLSWNLIDNHKIHFVASLITTIGLLITIFFAVANFGFHYGMHQSNEAPQRQNIESTSPHRSFKLITYQPMGNHRNSQVVIYRNHHHKVIHTDPDSKVTNRIVRGKGVKNPYMTTKAVKWEYRSPADKIWFGLAKKPSTKTVHHVFYVPSSWRVLSVKQTIALKQIIKNLSRQLNKKMNTPQAKQQIHMKATEFIKQRLSEALRKNPKMSSSQKKRLLRRAQTEFKANVKRDSEAKIVAKALRMAKTIN